MRTISNWELRVLPKIIPRFTPRIARDLQKIDLNLDDPSFSELSKDGYYIHGVVGSGKTILASRMVCRIHRDCYISDTECSFYLISVPDLLLEIKSCFDSKDKSEADVIRFYTQLDVLILDDLGTEKVSDWVFQVLYCIINRRYESLRTTIITSNLSLTELSEQLGDDRIPSRIYAMGPVIKLNEVDRRIK